MIHAYRPIDLPTWDDYKLLETTKAAWSEYLADNNRWYQFIVPLLTECNTRKLVWTELDVPELYIGLEGTALGREVIVTGYLRANELKGHYTYMTKDRHVCFHSPIAEFAIKTK